MEEENSPQIIIIDYHGMIQSTRDRSEIPIKQGEIIPWYETCNCVIVINHLANNHENLKIYNEHQGFGTTTSLNLELSSFSKRFNNNTSNLERKWSQKMHNNNVAKLVRSLMSALVQISE